MSEKRLFGRGANQVCMSKFAQKISEILVIALCSIIMGALVAFSEFRFSGDDEDGLIFLFLAVFSAIFFFIVFLHLYYNYKYKRNARKWLGELQEFHAKYPLSTDLLMEKYSIRFMSLEYHYYDYIKPRLSEYRSIVRQLRKKKNILNEEEELKQIVEINKNYANAYVTFLKEHNIKNHWVYCAYHIPEKREDIKTLLAISDSEWKSMAVSANGK